MKIIFVIFYFVLVIYSSEHLNANENENSAVTRDTNPCGNYDEFPTGYNPLNEQYARMARDIVHKSSKLAQIESKSEISFSISFHCKYLLNKHFALVDPY